MKKVTFTATTNTHKKALAAAIEAKDQKAIDANSPWTSTVEIPVDGAELIKAWKPDTIYDLCMRQFAIDQQTALRSANEPASPAAKKRAIIDALLKRTGKTLEQLEAELLGGKK